MYAPFAAASLVDVAVRAAVAAGAPRRTVASTAAAVASVVMAEMRGGAAARGRATSLSASQKRRIKRKKKAEKDKMAVSSLQPHLIVGEAGRGDVSGGDLIHATSLPAALAPDSVVVQPPLPLPTSGGIPRFTCQHCKQAFASRNVLFKHLKESGHSQFFLPSTADSESVSGLSAGSLDRTLASIHDVNAAGAALSSVVQASLQDGGNAGSTRSDPSLHLAITREGKGLRLS